jgi:hypothetical protein
MVTVLQWQYVPGLVRSIGLFFSKMMLLIGVLALAFGGNILAAYPFVSISRTNTIDAKYLAPLANGIFSSSS